MPYTQDHVNGFALWVWALKATVRMQLRRVYHCGRAGSRRSWRKYVFSECEANTNIAK